MSGTRVKSGLCAIFLGWWGNHVELDSNITVTLDDLYESYDACCRQELHFQPSSKREFAKLLKVQIKEYVDAYVVKHFVLSANQYAGLTIC